MPELVETGKDEGFLIDTMDQERLLGFLALPLSHSQPREGRGVRIVLGILVYLLYGNALYISKSWIAEGVLPASIGMWWVHILFLVISFWWIRRQGRFRAKNGNHSISSLANGSSSNGGQP